MTDHGGVTAIVLAGGRSARFGGDKLAVEIDGVTILERAIRAAGAVADEVIVVGSPSRGVVEGEYGRDAPRVRVVPDDEPHAGPLAALAGALRETTTALAVVVGGDMPRLVPGVLQAMVDRLRSDANIDAALLEGPDPNLGRRQVLPLALRVAPARTASTEVLREGDRSLIRLVGRLRSAEIPAPAWRAVDPDGGTLADVDQPADLQRIRDKFH